jgi:hypothetical protein
MTRISNRHELPSELTGRRTNKNVDGREGFAAARCTGTMPAPPSCFYSMPQLSFISTTTVVQLSLGRKLTTALHVV